MQYDSRRQAPQSPSRVGPAVPEPLVFDLVRPLGAGVGEVEVNTIGRFRGGTAKWAPEVEAVIAEDLALELEFPFEDSDLATYKVALQHTLAAGRSESFIQGLQAIVERERDEAATEVSLLHIGATRFDARRSALWMAGGRGHLGGDGAGGRFDLLLNASLFADLGPHLVAGLELNLAQPTGGGDTELLVMPQLHTSLTEHLHVQLGFGIHAEGDRTHSELALRVILAF